MKRKLKGNRIARITAGIVFILVALVFIYYVPTIIKNPLATEEAQELSAYADSLFASCENKLAAGKTVKRGTYNQQEFDRNQRGLDLVSKILKDKPPSDAKMLWNLKFKEGDYNLNLFMLTYDPEYLNSAVESFEEIKKEIIYEQSPAIYRTLYFNLGNAYLFQKNEDQNDKFNKVVNSYLEALEHSEIKTLLSRKGLTLYNLGYAYGFLSEKNDKRSKNKALEYFFQSLKIFKADMYTPKYEEIHNRIGVIYFQIAGIEDRENNLLKAAESFEEAIRVHNKEILTVKHAIDLNLLGLAYEELALIKDSETNLKKALDAYTNALDVFRNVTDSAEKHPYLLKRLPERIEKVEKKILD